MNRNTDNSPGKKKITGFHASLMFVAFFGVVAAVNFIMAGFAISSFGGTVVDNSYVASQKYNQWLKEGREQIAHGWSVEKPLRVENKLVLAVQNEAGQPLANAEIAIIAQHPVGRTESFNLSFSETAPGRYQSIESAPSGRWKLKISVISGDRRYDLLDEIK